MDKIWKSARKIIPTLIITLVILNSGLAQDTPEPTDEPLIAIPTATLEATGEPLFTIPTATPTPLPTPTTTPIQLETLKANGLQSTDVPTGFIAADYNGAVVLANLMDQLSEIYPDQFNALQSLLSLYELNNVEASSFADYFTELCEGQPIFGVGTWVRGLNTESSANTLASNVNLAELYGDAFNWDEIENDSFTGRVFTVSVNENVCNLPSQQTIVEYSIDRYIVAVSVYALDTTDSMLVDSVLEDVINAVNQRIEPSPAITAVPTETESSTSTPTAISTTDVPSTVVATATSVTTPDSEPIQVGYTETFDDNSRGWNLRTTNRWTIRLLRGQLSFSIEDGERTGVAIPDLDGDQYYIEVTVIPERDRGFIGFIVGELSSPLHYVLIGRERDFEDWVFKAEEQNGNQVRGISESIFLDRDENLFMPGEPITLGLELQDGVYTLYINNEAVDSVEFDGNDAALALSAGEFGATAALFDNLIVRQSREE